jgi:PAS domain S-box-containing protein
MDSYKYLLSRKHTLTDAASAELALAMLRGRPGLSRDGLAQAVGTLLEALILALRPDEPCPLDLAGWGVTHHEEVGFSLAELLQIVTGLRKSMLVGLPAEEAIELQTAVDVVLDTVTGKLVDVFATSQATLTKRVSEMENLARDLSTATEEADHALVQLQSLYDVSRQLSANLEVSAILQQATSYLTEATFAHSSAVWIKDGGDLRIGATRGVPPELVEQLVISLQATDCRLLDAIHDRDVVIVESPAEKAHDRKLLSSLDANVLLAIPLAVQSRVSGLVTLHSKSDRLVSDLDLARAIAQQTAIAMQNGQLFEEVGQLNRTLEERIVSRTRELEEEKEQLATMYEIAARMTSTLDLDRLINQTLKKVAEAVSAQDGVIMLNDVSLNGHLLCEASLNGVIKHHPPEGVNALLSDWVMSHREPVLVDDLCQDIRWKGDDNGNHSAIAAPLTADGDLHGVLLLSDPTPSKFTDSHMRLVETVAAQLAATVNNARLHDYVREQVIRLGALLRRQEMEDSQKNAILSSIADGVIASDNKGDILLVNPTAERIFGESAANLVGQPIEKAFEVLKPSGRRKILRTFSALKTLDFEGQTDPAEAMGLVFEIDNSIIDARLTVAHTSAMEFVGVVTVLRDITKEVEADRAKSDFVSMVSHELRTPMTSVKGYGDLLLHEAAGSLNEQQKHFLDIICRNADRLSLLINDILDVSRIEDRKAELDIKEIRLKELVGQVVEAMLIPARNKGLALTWDAPAEASVILADSDRITQVLTNLIGNAINYTETGSIRVSVQQLNHAVQISVKDTGIGISADALQHIFDRFYRADHAVVRNSSGTGLGLSITKALVEMHGGRIWVESKPGEGSTFTFVLPNDQS